MEIEGNAVKSILPAAEQSLQQALDVILECRGKIIVCGMGKSGHIARKIAATFTSIGQQAVFLHPAEAAHGDLGVYSPRDVTMLLSKSGSTDELLKLIPTLKAFQSKIIAIVGNANSPLAEVADVVVDISFAREADPLGIVPTTSAMVGLAIGDALAAEIMHARGVSKLDFARYHPAGQLGRNLLLRVGDVMANIERCACVSPHSTLREIVVEMTKNPLGAALIVDGDRGLLGIITDGDIRRSLQRAASIDDLMAGDIMTKNPRTIPFNASLGDAIAAMESGQSQISVLPVMKENGGEWCVAGIIRLHDVYRH